MLAPMIVSTAAPPPFNVTFPEPTVIVLEISTPLPSDRVPPEPVEVSTAELTVSIPPALMVTLPPLTVAPVSMPLVEASAPTSTVPIVKASASV